MVCSTTYILIALLVVHISSTAANTNSKEFPSQSSELKQRVSRVKRQWGWGYLAYPTTYVYRAPYVGYYGSWGYPMMGFYG